MGLGLGAIFRRTAGAIGPFIGAVLVLPAIALALPSPWNTNVSKYLPANAGQALLNVHHTTGALSSWIGFAVLCAWVAAALGVGSWLIAHRDA